MKIIVVRHGETDENIGHIMQGNMDTVLNNTGINQAIEVRNKLKDTNIDLIISSPLKRTAVTAQLISNYTIPIIYDKRLLSRNHGEFEGISRDTIDNNEYWNIKINKEYQTAESVADLFNRVSSLLNEIKEKYKNKTILLVTHSGICRVLYYYFNGIPEDGNILVYQSENCSIEKYDLEETV